ncbi:MAG TPA: hypothetical protein VF520_12740 [Thermoleophilaceae bacterium]|jgi:hypothetical protein
MRESRETAHLHFDLAHLPADGPYTLSAGRREYLLERHTRRSRAEARRANRALAELPDDRLTHHAGPVSLPADTPILLTVTGHREDRADGGLPPLHMTAIHLPRTGRAAGLEARLRGDYPDAPRPSAKLAALGLDEPADGDDAWVVVDVHDLKTATDMAESLVFHHPELATQHVPSAGIVMDVIDHARGINYLAESILEQSQNWQEDPEDYSNWVAVAPLLDCFSGDPVPGRSIYTWSDTTQEWMAQPLKDALQKTKNVVALEGRSWTAQKGVPSVTVPPQPTAPEAASAPGAAAPGAATARWALRELTPQSGLVHSDFSFDPSSGKASISYKNWFLRWLGCEVEFYGPDGERISTTDLGFISAVNTILAIPLPPTWSELDFQFPDGASSAVISAGGLGQVPIDWEHDGMGIVLTAIFDYALPISCLVLGVAVDDAPLKSMEEAVAPALLASFGPMASSPLGVLIGRSSPIESVISALGSIAGSLLLAALAAKGDEKLAAWYTAKLGEDAVDKTFPFAGWIVTAVGIVADLAAICETNAEVISSPATMQVRVERSMDVQVTVLPDADHQGQWPATATHYTVSLTYTDGTNRTIKGQMSATTQQGPISETFASVPAGGQVTVEAFVYSDTGWLAGKGKAGPLAAEPTQDATLVVDPFHIVENLVPLSATTQYEYKQKLGYQDDQHVWLPKSSAAQPTATVSSLDSGNIGRNLSALVGLTLNQESSRVGYTWRASGQGLPLQGHGSQPFTGQETSFQTISDGALPEDGLKLSAVGYSQEPYLVFQVSGGALPSGVAYLLEPDLGGQHWHLRAASLEHGEPLNVTPALSFGRFFGPQDSMAIHPAGYAVGVTTAWSKLQVLKLAAAPGADADALDATVYSGLGTRQGLLHDPVAVTCAVDGTVLVLQNAAPDASAPAGVAAFDVKGNYVSAFAGQSPWQFPLRTEALPVVALDVSAESKGYVFVLKYLRDPTRSTVLASDYRLDVYDPDGTFLTQTAGLAAAKAQVDLWRNLYALDYEVIAASPRTEPSVSFYVPSTPEE